MIGRIIYQIQNQKNVAFVRNGITKSDKRNVKKVYKVETLDELRDHNNKNHKVPVWHIESPLYKISNQKKSVPKSILESGVRQSKWKLQKKLLKISKTELIT